MVSTVGFLLLNVALVPHLLQNVAGQHDHNERFRQSLRKEWHTPMEIDVRDMHRYCIGECFYNPQSCKQTLRDFNCKNIVSVRKYIPSCSEAPDSPSKDLCTRLDHLFIISLLRTIPPGMVNAIKVQSYKSFNGRTFLCTVKPFVAIAFSENTDDSVTPTNVEESILGDVFYTCVANDPYVTTWIRRTKPLDESAFKAEPHCIDISAEDAKDTQTKQSGQGQAQGASGNAGATQQSTSIPISRLYTQLLDTNPYPPMGSSVLWSKVMTVYEQFAIGCKFIISDKDDDLTIYLNGSRQNSSVNPQQIKNGTDVGRVVSPIFFNRNIKIANGLAYSKDGIVENVVFSNKPAKAIALVDDLMDDASIDAMEGISDWNLASMQVPTIPPEPFLQSEWNHVAKEAINGTYEMCLNREAMCFVRDDEKNCILKHGCHYLTAIKSLNKKFSRLRFYMLTQPIKREGIFAWIHPQGWSAIGFSNDTKMGRDLVYTCTYRGETNHVLATHNLDQQNIFYVEPQYWIKRPMYDTVHFYLDMETETALCIFDVITTDVILQSFFYAPPNADVKLPNSWPRLHWYLQHHDFYILLSQGTNTYADDRISYHTYRTVSPQKFSKERYWMYMQSLSSQMSLKSIHCYIFLSFTLLILSKLKL